jgi:hypothetical protein
MRSKRPCLYPVLILLAAGAWAAKPAPAPTTLTFTKVWPQKIRYLNGETATFQITLTNPTAQPWAGRVIVQIESGLDQTTPVSAEAVTVAAGEAKVLDKSWKINLGEFGHTLHALAKNADGTVAAEGREVFCVGPWYYNMGRYSTYFNVGGIKSPEQALATAGRNWRDMYVDVIEHFSGSPGEWNGLTPTTPAWLDGQGNFSESAVGEHAVIDAAHSQGLGVCIYEIDGTCGLVGEEYSRAHPDWRPGGYFNMEKEDARYQDPLKPGTGGGPLWLSPDIARRDVQDSDIGDIVSVAKMFGYDGIRWDGQTCEPGFEYTGKPVAADLDVANAQWTAHMQDALLKALPGFTINYNYHPQGIEEGPNWPLTYKALGPHSYLLRESMRGRYQEANDPLNVWSNFVEGVRKEINQFARPGGNFQHFGWYACDSKIQQNHTQAIYYALGGHWDTWLVMKYDAFAMRYGAYLFDLRLKNLADGSALVQVTDPNNRLWWKQFVQELQLDGGHQLVISHVLNQPVHDRQNPFEKDAPPVQTDVKVTLTPPAGEKVTGAFLLNPDADRAGWCTAVQPVADGGGYSVTLPSVEYWSFVVWEVAR